MSKILLVDDDEFLSSIYSQKLIAAGFEVLLAAHGEDGKKMALKHHPDCIVLDIVMPKMDGFTLLSDLKSNPDTRDIPVMMCTNLAQKEDVDRCMELGAVAYLIKCHTTPEQLVEAVRRIHTPSPTV